MAAVEGDTAAAATTTTQTPIRQPSESIDHTNAKLWDVCRALAIQSRPNFSRPFKKLMCANRGEIAIRVFRAAHELGLETLAIFSAEDSRSLHRFRADESYLVGEGQAPVAAYLDIDDIIRIAKEHDVDCIHPGYGFLSESAEFARRCAAAGLVFVGPRPEVVDSLGTKTSARQVAIAAGVPVVPGTETACASVQEALDFAQEAGLPILFKAAYGGGGRGIRVIRALEQIELAFERSQAEALAAFGNGSVFLEKYVENPRHVEVQILGDEHGNIVHLFERDCSIQRRFQKVVEVAPATALPESVRAAIHADAIKIAKQVNYINAGTCEFLVSPDFQHYFIEVNPRVQVEHTITEEITGHDIVRAQICIAAGVSLPDLGLVQSEISYRGVAIQLRITTEDPLLNFQPDAGRLEVYRSSGGVGVRQDSSCSAGTTVAGHYDSLMVKLIVSGITYQQTVLRALRALAEFRVRGVKTNIAFLQRLLSHESFYNNTGIHTTFIDKTPEVLKYHSPSDRVSKLLNYLGDAVVNGIEVPTKVDSLPSPPPAPPLSRFGDASAPLTGFRDVLLQHGAKAFAAAVRKHRGLLLMDTTWRDAHQSLLATRVRTQDMARIAPATAMALAGAYSLECWGGATFDVAMRFLHECPWHRLDQLRALVPNIPFQMLLRGANAVGYTAYPDNVVYEFVKKAKEHGVDVFRVFDSLNYIDNLRLGIDAIHAAGGVVEACICYSGDVSNASLTKYTLEYYVDLVRKLVELDIHVLAIKDMAGLLKPRAATMLVAAIRAEFPHLPIHVHTHDTAGTGVASMLAAAEAGADVVDVAIDSLSGLTSQPSMGALVGAVAGTPLDTGILAEHVVLLNNYWEAARKMYAAFESASLRSGSADVYLHEMPGGQYTNLQFQADQLGLGSRWTDIKTAYRHANQLLGDVIKVTPSSKVVGDLAQFLVQNDLDVETFRARAKTLSPPLSVVQFMQGFLGEPVGGFPEPLRSDIVGELPRVQGRPGAQMAPLDLRRLRVELEEKHRTPITDVDVLSAALYPAVFDDFAAFRNANDDLSVLPTNLVWQPLKVGQEVSFEIKKGYPVFIKLLAIGQPQASGFREVFFDVNSNGIALTVRDRSALVDTSAARERADDKDAGSVGAPMAGTIVDVRVAKGDQVSAGQPLAVMSAMKMETVLSAPVAGTVRRVVVDVGDALAAGDLIVALDVDDDDDDDEEQKKTKSAEQQQEGK